MEVVKRVKTSVGYYEVKIANPTCFHKRKENEMCESCLLKPKALAIYNTAKRFATPYPMWCTFLTNFLCLICSGAKPSQSKD